MDAAFTILLALASQSFTANFGLSAENSTGQRPLVVGGDEELVTEFQITPRAGLDISFKRSSINFNYSPRAYSRINLESENTTFRPLLLHGFGAGFNHSFTPRLRLNFSASGSVGEVDYGGVDLLQGRTQVVPGGEPTDPRISAAGSVPQGQETFASQDYVANLGLSWVFVRNHTLTLGVSGNYNASLGSDPIFPDNYGGNANLGWSWQFNPRYGFNLNGSYGESRVERAMDATTGTGGTGEFRSFNLSAGFNGVFTRYFNASLAGGVLIADNQPPPPATERGISASPTGNLSFTFIPTSGRGNYHLSTTFGAGIEGFVDPLSDQGFAPRLALNWSLGFTFFQDWSLSPNASLFTPLSAPSGMADSLNETLVTFAVPLSYQITPEVGMAIGVRYSGRGSSLRQDNVTFDQHFVTGFLSFTAGVATRL